MNLNNIRECLFCFLIISVVFFITGAANAQHEGGLGTKKVHLNIATVDQLIKIDGMTEDLAKAIVKYRETSGLLQTPEELLKVPGMTKDVYDKLNPQTGSEGDLFCVPKKKDEYEEELILSPSKC